MPIAWLSFLGSFGMTQVVWRVVVTLFHSRAVTCVWSRESQLVLLSGDMGVLNRR